MLTKQNLHPANELPSTATISMGDIISFFKGGEWKQDIVNRKTHRLLGISVEIFMSEYEEVKGKVYRPN